MRAGEAPYCGKQIILPDNAKIELFGLDFIRIIIN